VRGIYPGRNQIGVRQRSRVEIGPSLNPASSGPNVNKFSAKQALVNTLEFVQVAQRLFGILQQEKIPFDKSVGSGRENSAGILLAVQCIEVGTNPR
jgi:hypothetical protein